LELEESNDDRSNQGKEAGGAQDHIREDKYDVEDNEEADDSKALKSKSDGEEEAELALLRHEMDTLEWR
jgi:hypothetical protein